MPDSLPTIQLLSYADGMAVVTLSSTPATPVTGAIFKGSPSGTGWMASALSTGNQVSISIDPSQLDGNYQYTVAVATNPSTPDWGPPAILVFQVPTLSAIGCAPELVEVAWSIPATNSFAGNAVKAILYDAGNSITIASKVSTDAGVRLQPAVPLDPNGSYAVFVLGQNGISSGPLVESLPLILASAAVGSVAYAIAQQGGRLAVTVQPAGAIPSGFTLAGALLAEGSPVSRQPASAGVVVFPLAQPLDPALSWKVQLGYRNGIVTGPPGTPYPVALSPAPGISQLEYAGGVVLGTLDAPATPVATAALFKGTPAGTAWIASATTSTGNFQITVDPSVLNPTDTYMVALTLDPTAQPVKWSVGVPLVFQQPSFTAAALSSNSVKIRWSLPPTTNISEVSVSLYDETTAQVIATNVFGGVSATLPLALPLDPTHTYIIALRARSGLAIGPMVTSAALLLSAPAIAQVVCASVARSQTSNITVTPQAVTSPPANIVVGRLFADGTLMAEASGDNTSVVIPWAQQSLDPASRWEVALLYRSAAGIDSPLCATTEIPSEVPILAGAAFDGAIFELSWSLPAGVPGAVVSLVRVEDAVQVGSATVPVGASAPITPTVAIDPSKQYAVLFAPVAGRARGFFGTGAPLIVAPPSVSSVSTDGVDLAVVLAGLTTGASVLTLFSGGAEVHSAEAGSAGGFLRLPGFGLQNPTVTARASNGTVLGPPSAAVAPLVAAPTPGTVALGVDTQQKPLVKAVLTTPAGVPAGTTYRAWLLAGDNIVSGPVAAVTDQGVTTVSFPFAATGLTGLSIVAQAQVTGSAPTLAGPRSAPVPVLAVAPSFAAALISPVSSTEWKLEASWLPPADGAAIVSYALSLIKNADSSVVASATFGAVAEGPLTFAMSAVDATLPYSLTLLATSANGSMTPLASTAVWFAAAAFTAVTSGPGRVNARWTAPVGPTGVAYQLSLLDTVANTVLATTVTAATSGGLDVSALGLLPSGSYALALGIQIGPVLFQAGSDETYKTRPALLLNQPTGLAVTTDPASGKATLNWSAIPGATGYTVAFSNGSAPVPVSTASYPFPSALSAGADLRVSVTANIVSSNVVSTGPPSASLAMPTLGPVLTSADYDGVNVSGAWAPLAGAAGYVATILNAAGAAVGSSPQTSDTTVVFPLALTAADGPFTIVVQALTDAGSGLPSAPLPLFQPALFVSTVLPGTELPNIYPAATLALGATQISIYLPPLANAAITVSPVGAFNLQANTDSASKAALPYMLTFAADSEAWKFSAGGNPLPAIRPQLQLDYISFLQAAETAGASAWGISLLQQAISRWMPQTFAESHYYAYGLSLTGGPGTGSIDLRQGLVLRVGFANYTNVWSGQSNSWLNGFGGGSPADFDVADGVSGAGGWQLSMDSFVAMLTASGAMTVAPPGRITATGASAGVADAADLFFPSFPNPFYRLFFPRQLEDPTGTGSTSTAANFALASAASFTALSSSTPLPGTTTPVAFFRGRAVLRLMIRIRVNDVELVVPLGTTVGNVLDRYGVRPPATKIQLIGVALERASGPGLAVLGPSPQPPPLTYDSATRRRVRLDWSTMANYVGPVDATNLPLLHGDRMAF